MTDFVTAAKWRAVTRMGGGHEWSGTTSELQEEHGRVRAAISEVSERLERAVLAARVEGRDMTAERRDHLRSEIDLGEADLQRLGQYAGRVEGELAARRAEAEAEAERERLRARLAELVAADVVAAKTEPEWPKTKTGEAVWGKP